MKISTIKTLAISGLIALMILMLPQVILVTALPTNSAKAESLSFIQEVVQLNISQYNVTMVSDVVGQSPVQPSETIEIVDYHLANNGSGLEYRLSIHKQYFDLCTAMD